MIKPFSDNIIFFDTEFTSLDPNKSELISIGLVKPSGEELYLELDCKSEPSDWVKKNVLPFLSGERTPKKKAVEMVKKFLGDKKPYIVGYINQDDVIYWQKLYFSLGLEDDPFNLVSIDFSNVLFMLGIDPKTYSYGEENGFFERIGIDYKKYHKHNALDDARILREVYMKFVKNPAEFINQSK